MRNDILATAMMDNSRIRLAPTETSGSRQRRSQIVLRFRTTGKTSQKLQSCAEMPFSASRGSQFEQESAMLILTSKGLESSIAEHHRNDARETGRSP
jgi:hypothetical protein